ARPSGQIRWVSAQPSGHAIITIWSNPNGSYLPDRTLARLQPPRLDQDQLRVCHRGSSGEVDPAVVDGRYGFLPP
ncbi:MAG TPA: hypothetical protein VFY73_13595, partial [Ideonella sp.]|uniref:hypothetical protein n=1 Tax=Ideonella sp. TaxID=1929293 RepID=UPI002E34B868